MPRATVLLLSCALAACGPTSLTNDDTTPDGGGRDAAGGCTGGERICDTVANTLLKCQSGQWVTAQQCAVACDPTLGCVACVPGATRCEGQDVVACTAQGTPGGVIAHCQGTCQSGHCSDPCGQAEESRSYLGCEYWPTVTMNPALAPGFSFALAVANASQGGSAADITITGGALTTPLTQTIASGALATITLPWVEDLRSPPGLASILKPNGAYHLVSNQPITVYQFNALEYVVSETYSFTNDASLLLPRHVLGDDTGTSTYLVIARPSFQIYSEQPFGGRDDMWYPGFVAVVGTADGTRVDIDFSARTVAGSTGVPAAYLPGESGSFPVDTGTVLMIGSGRNDGCVGEPDPANNALDKQFYCDLSNGYDLTGTEIRSDKPVAVFAGNACSFVPFDKWACDHLEEQLFPVSAWGKHYVATRAVSTPNPNLWRVISGHDGTSIQFDPPVHDPVVIDKGQWFEFVTAEDFEVVGDQAFMIAGFMVGQDYSDQSTAVGDPAMALGVPVEQYRGSYVFLAPESYDQNYVNIVAKTGATVLLDDAPVTGFAPVGTGAWSVAKISIAGGAHTIKADGTDGCGIQVYGVGSYTSYMYPGGLDVKQINVPG
ncbi:MAG TPA: IgGFc-binding protein [Polyangia bacterium]|jgi:hypothetical protein